jgi:small nuclear ribonucleoprotein (snRNP)-like protein
MKKISTFLLIGFILNAVFYTSSAHGTSLSSKSTKEEKMIVKLKNGLHKIGVGEDSKVRVKLDNGTKVSGYLSEINNHDFVIVTPENKASRIHYEQVKSARGKSRYGRFSCSKALLFSLALGTLLIALTGDVYQTKHRTRYPYR